MGGFISVNSGHDDSVALKLGGQMNAPAYVVSGTTTGNALSGARYIVSSGTSVSTVTNQIRIVHGIIQAECQVWMIGLREKIY